MSFLRIYTRVFSLDLDDTVEEQLLIGDRPKISDSPESKLPLKDRLPMRKQEELKEVRLNSSPVFSSSQLNKSAHVADDRRTRVVRVRYGALRLACALPRPRATAARGRLGGSDEADGVTRREGSSSSSCYEGHAFWGQLAEDEWAQETRGRAACCQGSAGVHHQVL